MKKILEFMAKNYINPTDISIILITHGHSDHFGSVYELKNITGAKVAIHKLDSDAIRRGKNPPLHSRNLTGKLLSTFIKVDVAGFRCFEPDIYIEDEMSLKDYGVDAKVILTPGHTLGSVSVAVQTGELILGDLISGGLLKSDKPRYSSYCDDFYNMRSSMRSVMKLSPRVIYVGHGGPFLPDLINKNIRF